MAVCTFFGHRDCPISVRSQLYEVLVKLIVDCGVDQFYVGHQGAFDTMTRVILRELVEIYPHISYAVVLERLPERRIKESWDFSDTIYPEGLESVPPRFAVARRNEWMLSRADYVVTYITHTWGGAARFAAKALRQKKYVVNLADYPIEKNET